MEKSISVAVKLRCKTDTHEEKEQEALISQIPENLRTDRKYAEIILTKSKKIFHLK